MPDPGEQPLTDWLTCECCGSTDDETTNGRECEDDEYINLCDGCVAVLTLEADDA